MQLKSTRGVQQDDVWAAADALIAVGLRPTIERVRQKIGRGSPNTVSPILEAWFATLGPRLALGGPKADEGGPPPAVRQTMAKLWEVALSTALQQATEDLALTRLSLENERAALAKRESELGHQTEILNERLAALDTALVNAKKQMFDLNTRLEEARILLKGRAMEIEHSSSKLAAMEHQLADGRKQRDLEALRHAEERQRLEVRAVANEQRLMGDLDRERQECKRAKVAANQAERQAETLRDQLEADTRTLAGKVRDKENELLSVRQALVTADERSAELRVLLEQQRSTTGAALEQLSRHLVVAARETASVIAKRKRATPSKTSQ